MSLSWFFVCTNRGIIAPTSEGFIAHSHWRIRLEDTSGNSLLSSRAVGRALTFLLLPSGSAVPLGPLWSVLCGATAAGLSWPWDGHTVLRLVLVILIAEGLWSTWRALLVDLSWRDYIFTHPLPSPGDPVPRLPYTAPWSPVGRQLGRWSRLRRWMRETLPIVRRGALLTLPILPPLALLLSTAVGWEMTLLSLAALALSTIEWRVARQRRSHHALRAGLEVGLSWLAGHMVFRSLTSTSFALACCYALAYQGAITLDDSRRAWSTGLMCGGQTAAIVLVTLQAHPLATHASIALSFLLVPQLLLLSRLRQREQHIWYLRRAVPFLMVAMPIAAWVG